MRFQPMPVALVGGMLHPGYVESRSPAARCIPTEPALGVGAVTSTALVEHALLEDLIGPNQ